MEHRDSAIIFGYIGPYDETLHKLYKDSFVGKGDAVQRIEWVEYFPGPSGRW